MAQELNDTRKKELADRIAASAGRKPFRAGMFGLERFPLPFYKNAFDVHIKDFSTRPFITREYVCDDERVFEPDGEEETLLEINKALSLTLTADNAAQYAAFYFQKVAIDDSFARLVFSADDVIDENFDEDLCETLKKIIRTPVVDKTGDGFTVSGFVLLDDTLFKADLGIDKDGSLSIDDEEAVYEDLPVKKIMLR